MMAGDRDAAAESSVVEMDGGCQQNLETLSASVEQVACDPQYFLEELVRSVREKPVETSAMRRELGNSQERSLDCGGFPLVACCLEKRVGAMGG